MRIFIHNILYFLAFLFIISCSDEILPESDTVAPGDIILSVSSIVPDTRAVVGEIAGVNSLNENKINTVHYFFYPRNVDNNKVSQPAHEGIIEDIGGNAEFTWTVNVTEDKLKQALFPMPYNVCDVYVIVNLPKSISDVIAADPDYDKSLSSLRRIVLEANFDTTDPQESFVMEGLGVATIIDRKALKAASGTINVDRVAAKISVDVTVDDQLTATEGDASTNDMLWVPMPEDMLIELVNGVKTAVLAATPTEVNNENTFPTTARGVTENEGVLSCFPFYTYPAKWDVGADNEPYLRITLPCKTTIYTDRDGQTIPIEKQEKCIYKVILGGETLSRNTWYDLDINIGILGSFENEKEVVIPFEDTHYFVADWSKEDIRASTNASIEGARYLILDKYEYNLYTQDEIRIPFTSSHICEIVDMSGNKNQATVTYPDYSADVPNENASHSWNNSNWHISIDKSVIVFRHALRNDISAGKGNYDYAPYTIKFTIRHADEKGDIYYKDITIKQYPAMIIECKPNRNIQNDGGVSVNNGSNYGGVHGLTGQNKNPNMYVIQTSVLPPDSKYIIGDPRSQTVNNLDNNSWASAKGIENLNGNNRKLSYYYPTLTDEASRSIIAPKFRIASSYGVTNSISYTNAQYRCASYQEDGYPAGRWRLPTQAEVQFIVQLSAHSVIPALFTNGNAYWCAGGKVTPNANGTVTISTSLNNTGPVRCVYDEWYWENTAYPRMPDNNVAFTWGDAQR